MKNTAIVKIIGKLSLAMFMLASVNLSAQKDEDEDEPVAKEPSFGYIITTKMIQLKER